MGGESQGLMLSTCSLPTAFCAPAFRLWGGQEDGKERKWGGRGALKKQKSQRWQIQDSFNSCPQH